MDDSKKSIDKLLESLQERAKELNCLYRIEELLNRPDAGINEVCREIIEAIPPGWQYPDICRAKILIDNDVYTVADFVESPWVISADIRVHERIIGTISIYYTEEMPVADDGPFLKEELKLVRTIADRLGHFILHSQMKQIYAEWHSARKDISEHRRGEWQVVLDLLRQTDQALFMNISHKMLNHLCWSGIEEAEKLLKETSVGPREEHDDVVEGTNSPHQIANVTFPILLSGEIFRIADENIPDDELLTLIQKWIQEDKLSFLVQVVNRNLSLSEVADAVRRFYHTASSKGDDLLSPSKKGIVVSLIRRFLSDHLTFLNIAKNFININDFYELLNNIIFTTESHGKLGGKSAGMYLAAQIIESHNENGNGQMTMKIPKTWYITSDMLLHFMHYNNLDEIVEQKYKEIDQVRFEYPHIVHTFKNSHFPPEMVKGLSVALDEFGDKPLIVRSSSLLEDRMGAAFSGKYKSVFIANQGSKQKRLEALLDAISEVYASTFGPDPIEYRTEKGLIDFGEEMGVMIQEVVGTRVGDYFMPAFAGVAFSHNEFRWSPRIKREDGLVRMVPGLGTRAVDRLSDDYPVMFAPGQPGLRVNVSVDDVLRYSPRYIDVINLKRNMFETVETADLLKRFGYEFPNVKRIVSIHDSGHIRKPIGMQIDFDNDDLVVTFDGLLTESPFISQIHSVLQLLEKTMGVPVDMEFAHDGKDLYLLQCRPQSHADSSKAAPIPKDIPDEKIIFSAKRYVSNGRVPDITHVVYVDPDKYSELSSREELLAVARAVGRLNKLLPKRQFILIGPGRWGSRGDIKLGVAVTYSDINNTAMLIEVARKKGNYTPDLSFGTHFFQDLVEARIRYLPLYPDDDGIVFNERFLRGSPNILCQLIPDCESLVDTIRLIDIPSAANGQVLRVLMNADLDEAVAMLGQRSSEIDDSDFSQFFEEKTGDSSWRWRYQMAEHIASCLDPVRFGVKGFYVFGSTKNATAAAASDIDILVHFAGNTHQLSLLDHWLEGWSLALGRINYLRTGYDTERLLDVHIITDEDIRRKTSYAAKINAITDSARPLSMMRKPSSKQ
jgi:predicted nucleotidyltransferase